MNRTARLTLTAATATAAALALTACEYTPDETTAQVACEQLVAQDLRDPDAAEFQHHTTTQEDDRWAVSGVVTIGDGTDRYRCNVEFHDGADFTGNVTYVTQ